MFSLRKFKDTLMKHVLFGVGVSNILIIFLIFFFIFINGIKFFSEYPTTDFFFGSKWISLSEIFGLLPLLVGSFWVIFIALLIAIPIGIITAIYISEYATPKIRTILKIIIETMSAIPSVVLGFIGLYLLAAPIKNIFGLDTGLNALTGGIMLAFMAIPTIVTIADDSLMALDKSYKQASLALGANKIETILNVLLPASFPGIFAGIMLGFGRIIGETLAVLMITGNSPIMATTPLSPIRTLTATIASEMGEVVQGSTHYHALFAIGLVLFAISFFTNYIADKFSRKARQH